MQELEEEIQKYKQRVPYAFIIGFILGMVLTTFIVNSKPDYSACDPMTSDECYTDEYSI